MLQLQRALEEIMNRWLPFAIALALTCCAARPEPLDLRSFEALDFRFEPPPPQDPTRVASAILQKEVLTLQDVLEIAELLNPELSAERKNIDLATAAIWEAKLYPNPSLLLGFEDYRTRDGATLGKMERGIGLSVPLVVSGRIGAATAIAEKDRELAAVNYIWRRREILSEVKKGFVSYLGSRRSAELARETRDLAKILHDVANERFQAQAVPEMEILKAAVQLAKAESDLRLAEKDLAVSLKVLHARMGSIDIPKENFVGELASRFDVPSFEVLRGQVITVHPLLDAATKSKESAELRLDLLQKERIPDLGLQVSVGKDPADASIVEAGLTVPLPIFSRNQGKISAAQTQIHQARLKIDAVRNELLLRFTEAYRDFTASQDRVAVYMDQILPKGEKALEQTNEGYRNGKFGYLDVLDAQRTLAEARIAYATALADLNSLAVELEKLVGTKLETIR